MKGCLAARSLGGVAAQQSYEAARGGQRDVLHTMLVSSTASDKPMHMPRIARQHAPCSLRAFPQAPLAESDDGAPSTMAYWHLHVRKALLARACVHGCMQRCLQHVSACVSFSLAATPRCTCSFVPKLYSGDTT